MSPTRRRIADAPRGVPTQTGVPSDALVVGLNLHVHAAGRAGIFNPAPMTIGNRVVFDANFYNTDSGAAMAVAVSVTVLLISPSGVELEGTFEADTDVAGRYTTSFVPEEQGEWHYSIEIGSGWGFRRTGKFYVSG